MEKPENILLVAEEDQRGMAAISIQLVSAALKLKSRHEGRIFAVLTGPAAESTALALARLGPEVVYRLDQQWIEEYPQECSLAGLISLIQKVKAGVILFGATDWGKDLAVRTAARLGAGFLADVSDFELDPQGKIMGTYKGFGGHLICKAWLKGPAPRFVTIKLNSFPPAAVTDHTGRVEVWMPELDPAQFKIRLRRRFPRPPLRPDLEEAEVVVAGGRGVGGREGFARIEELASLLGGAVGCTRPPVEQGWMDEKSMIGATGRTVRPKLYIGCGIYGDIYHTSGMDESERIVVINDDQKAPFFEMATCGLVGDLHEIVPCLIGSLREELKKEGICTGRPVAPCGEPFTVKE